MCINFVFFFLLFISNASCYSDPDDMYTIGLLSKKDSDIDKEIMNSVKLAFTEANLGRSITFNFIEDYYDHPKKCGERVEYLIGEKVSAIFGGMFHDCLVNASSVLKNSNIMYLTPAFGLDSECNSNVISSPNFIRRLSTIMAPQFQNVVFVGKEDSYFMDIAKQMYNQYNLYNIFNNSNFDFIFYKSPQTGVDIGDELVKKLPSGGYLISFLDDDDLISLFPDINTKISGKNIKLVCFYQTCSQVYFKNQAIFQGQLLYSSYINESSVFYKYYINKYPIAGGGDILIAEYMFNSFLLALSFRKAISSTHFTLPSIIRPMLIGTNTFDNISININSNNIFVSQYNIFKFQSTGVFSNYGNMTTFHYINPYSISPFLPTYYSNNNNDANGVIYMCKGNEIITKPVHHIIVLHKTIVLTLYADYLESIFYELININYNGGLLSDNYYILPHFISINYEKFIKYIKYYIEDYNVKTLFGVEPDVEIRDEFYNIIESNSVMYFVLSPSNGYLCSSNIIYINTVLYYSAEFIFSITPFIPEYQYRTHIIVQSRYIIIFSFFS